MHLYFLYYYERERKEEDVSTQLTLHEDNYLKWVKHVFLTICTIFQYFVSFLYMLTVSFIIAGFVDVFVYILLFKKLNRTTIILHFL
jgi:hypothetical protein